MLPRRRRLAGSRPSSKLPAKSDTSVVEASDRDVTAEIFSIAVPTLATLAVDPLSGLVDTGFLGHLGSPELAGTGVSLSIFATATKLINVPLLAVTTSSVGAAVGKSGDPGAVEVGRAATSVLVAALSVGVAEVVVLNLTAEPGLQAWGLDTATSAFQAGADYLEVRSWGAPVTVVLLVTQGIFRGLGDAVTPFRATVLACVVNLLLDPLFIFTCGLGVRGAAYATVIGEGVAAAYLIRELSQRCDLEIFGASLKEDISSLARPTGFLMLRTLALSGTFAYATSTAARISVDATAAYEICVQIWLASSLLADALAVAVQTLLAKSYSSRNVAESKTIVDRSLQLGGGLGVFLAFALFAAQGPLLHLFSDRDSVLALASASFLYVYATQPLNTLAFVWDGALYGVGSFGYAALAMPVCVAPSIFILYQVVHMDADVGTRSAGIWLALGILMGMRSLAAWLPYKLKRGPFRNIALPDTVGVGSTTGQSDE